jgi:hypothetical protein
MANFSNSKSVAQLESEGTFYGIAHSKKNDTYFLVLLDEEGNQISSGSEGYISAPALEELLAIPAAQRDGIPGHFVISDIEIENEETGEVRELKMLHKKATLAPLVFGAKKKVSPTASKAVQSKVIKKPIDKVF